MKPSCEFCVNKVGMDDRVSFYRLEKDGREVPFSCREVLVAEEHRIHIH